MRLFVSLVLFAIYFLFPKITLAQEFQAKIDAEYDIDSSGVTTVTEEIILKNLTDKFYPSSYTLEIDAADITNVIAKSGADTLETSLAQEGGTTKINTKIHTQVIGKDKETKFNLLFKSNDFAQKQGNVWQVTIPKITKISDVDQFSLLVSVPVNFGDPSSIYPEPDRIFETQGKLNYKFSKEKILKSGIMAHFGKEQKFEFNLGYFLENNGLFPALKSIALPPNTNYQTVAIENINPKPENVTVDSDGNYLAWFKMERRQNLNVSVSGIALINSREKSKDELTLQESQRLTSGSYYWSKDNPLIKATLSEIFKGRPQVSGIEKARLINQFVVDTLEFNFNRLESKDFERLGSLSALQSPNKALAAEFADLFITLARAENIPARQLIGYAYSKSQKKRPISYNGGLLHTWPQYYSEGWAMIDPTWQHTGGGVNYFDHLDFQHLVIAISSGSVNNFSLPSQINVNFSEKNIQVNPKIVIDVSYKNIIFAGFPSKVKVMIANLGNAISAESKLTLSSAKIEIQQPKEIAVSPIPPFGKASFEFDLRPALAWQSFEDIIQVEIHGQKIDKSIEVRPFFEARIFPLASGGLLASMFFVYLIILLTYRKDLKRIKLKRNPQKNAKISKTT